MGRRQRAPLWPGRGRRPRGERPKWDTCYYCNEWVGSCSLYRSRTDATKRVTEMDEGHNSIGEIATATIFVGTLAIIGSQIYEEWRSSRRVGGGTTSIAPPSAPVQSKPAFVARQKFMVGPLEKELVLTSFAGQSDCRACGGTVLASVLVKKDGIWTQESAPTSLGEFGHLGSASDLTAMIEREAIQVLPGGGNSVLMFIRWDSFGQGISSWGMSIYRYQSAKWTEVGTFDLGGENPGDLGCKSEMNGTFRDSGDTAETGLVGGRAWSKVAVDAAA